MKRWNEKIIKNKIGYIADFCTIPVIYVYILTTLLFILTGCSAAGSTDEQSSKIQEPEINLQTNEIQEPEIELQTPEPIYTEAGEEITAPVIEEVDWTNYFDGINGTAVIYDSVLNSYQIYHQESALTRRSPCSTFKIISSLIALEHGIIEPDNSVRIWSGENFWNEKWNQDIDFADAFRSSCVWYFREVINEIGTATVTEELARLQYGNCDISDWEGRLNTNNSNPALTGFWLESSLLISPMEQTEVMERIFGNYTNYSEETINQLKQVMLLEEPVNDNISIYGKTGMGKSQGIVVDSWFTGFADTVDKRIYFCVYLGESNHKDVSSTLAKEIAITIVSDYIS